MRNPLRLTVLIVVPLIASLLAADEPAKPDAKSLDKAKKEIQDIYATDIKKAKKPNEKIALAKEFIKVASETKENEDSTSRFALLAMATDLAIEVRDRNQVMECVRLIAESFQPGEGEPTEGKAQLTRAQALWKEADVEKAESEKQLRLQADAIEWFIRAKPTAIGINKALIEKRLDDFCGNSGDINVLIGSWDVHIGTTWHSTFKFQTDGTVIHILEGKEYERGKWSADPKRINIKWDNGKSWASFNKPIDPKGVTGDSWSGLEGVRAKKIIEKK